MLFGHMPGEGFGGNGRNAIVTLQGSGHLGGQYIVGKCVLKIYKSPKPVFDLSMYLKCEI